MPVITTPQWTQNSPATGTRYNSPHEYGIVLNNAASGDYQFSTAGATVNVTIFNHQSFDGDPSSLSLSGINSGHLVSAAGSNGSNGHDVGFTITSGSTSAGKTVLSGNGVPFSSVWQMTGAFHPWSDAGGGFRTPFGRGVYYMGGTQLQHR